MLWKCPFITNLGIKLTKTFIATGKKYKYLNFCLDLETEASLSQIRQILGQPDKSPGSCNFFSL